jgi:hypothetical protein
MEHFLQESSTVQEFCMTDLIEYESPDDVPEWDWVRAHAIFESTGNGEGGIWDFIINVDIIMEYNNNIPTLLQSVLNEAKLKSIKYLVFHQGT